MPSATLRAIPEDSSQPNPTSYVGGGPIIRTVLPEEALLDTTTLTPIDAAAWLGVTKDDLLTLVDADIVEPPVLVDWQPRFAASQLAQLRVIRDSAGRARSITRTVHIPARS